MKSVRRLISVVAFPLVLVACAGGKPSAPTGGEGTTSPPAAQVTTPAEPECSDLTGSPVAQIVMIDFTFDPSCSIVSGDQKLEFVNEGKNRHSFTVPKLDLDVLSGESELTKPIGQVLKPGETHTYQCKYHPRMTAELQVE
jgi:plastocyanin